MERIQLTMKEIKRGKVMEQLSRRELTTQEAAEILSITPRQVSRLLKRYQSAELAGLAHKGRGRPSEKRRPDDECLKIVELIKESYWDYGPTLAAETLEERNDIKISKESARQLMINHGIWQGRRHYQKHRSWRKPRSLFGQMVQLDGSWHDWFERRAPWAMLIRLVDDATSKVLFALFAPNESYESVATATIAYLKQYGMPDAFYTDKGGVFRVNNGNDDGESITQYEYALSMLNISLIHANSPQAKGRIERSFQTDQDRLVKMMRLDGISSIEAANKYLIEVYIPLYNRKFSRPAEIEGNAHQPLNNINLYDVFCIREERVVQSDWTIRFNNTRIQICDQRPAIVKPKDTVNVCKRLDGSLYITIRAQRLDFKIIASGLKTHKEPKPISRRYKPATRFDVNPSGSIQTSEIGHFHFAEK
jgi:DNA-binding transcriptional ArsR family regulator